MRIIRVAVNNLAGVPSIVYGFFGLWLFRLFFGGNIDQLFYPEALPAPTFGTPWLDVGVFDTGTADCACGHCVDGGGLSNSEFRVRFVKAAWHCATLAETLFKVILPMASPAILTGVILAVARAAGEVAPLMLVCSETRTDPALRCKLSVPVS